MDNPAILRRLTELLQERVGDTEAPITAQTRLQELGIDSIIQVDIMLDLETELGFTFRSMSLPKDPTVAEIVDLVRGSMAGGATA
ncbi:MAG TPA: acyl carrier protein [Luteimonas sp.]|nr:acyl carrier protein [Luteimonas sp.]HRO27573.1 acyl carrier protein [Luteimonas sp.]HRP73841.1 acyl carrier protein [Luteimonas sp.]